ncbi:MAG: hypothetical protein ABS942_17355 [Solibacillus sp.]
MTHFEYLESVGQTNIFDYIDITPQSKRNNGFVEGDSVTIRFYVDELSYIKECHPQLMKVGYVVGKRFDFYMVKFDGETIEVPGEKLSLV